MKAKGQIKKNNYETVNMIAKTRQKQKSHSV